MIAFECAGAGCARNVGMSSPAITTSSTDWALLLLPSLEVVPSSGPIFEVCRGTAAGDVLAAFVISEVGARRRKRRLQNSTNMQTQRRADTARAITTMTKALLAPMGRPTSEEPLVDGRLDGPILDTAGQ